MTKFSDEFINKVKQHWEENKGKPLGNNALDSNQTGTNNTAIGYLALDKTLEDENVAVGNYALRENTTGE